MTVMSDKSIPHDFDAGEREKRVVASTKIREDIASDLAALLRHAEREGWGKQIGSPTLSGRVLIYHFDSGRRGIVHLPSTADLGNKGT